MKKLAEKKPKKNQNKQRKHYQNQKRKEERTFRGRGMRGRVNNFSFFSAQLSSVHAAPRGNARLMNFLTFDLEKKEAPQLDFLSQTH